MTKQCNSCGKQIDDKWEKCFACKFPEKAKMGFSSVKATETSFGKPNTNQNKNKETTMIRMSALKNAVELMSLMQGAGVLQKEQATLHEAKIIAEQFVGWINSEE